MSDDANFISRSTAVLRSSAKGRPFPEMPSLTARTCGICPVSHLVASSKACDHLLSVTIPPTAKNLRRVMNLAQLAQSHALSFFHLSAPDLLLGFGRRSGRAKRLWRHAPRSATGSRWNTLATGRPDIIEILGGKKIHPGWMVPGGVNEPLTEEKRRPDLRAMIPTGLESRSANLSVLRSKSIGEFQGRDRTLRQLPNAVPEFGNGRRAI